MAARRKAKTKGKPGRPTKRDERAEATIFASLRDGCSIKTAAQCAGVDLRTLDRWREADPVFAQDCEKAIAEARSRMSAAIFRKAIEQGDTTAAIWWQKTRDPEAREAKDRPQLLAEGLGIEAADTPQALAEARRSLLEAALAGKLDMRHMPVLLQAIDQTGEAVMIAMSERLDALEQSQGN